MHCADLGDYLHVIEELRTLLAQSPGRRDR